jgi:hypothetical protein
VGSPLLDIDVQSPAPVAVRQAGAGKNPHYQTACCIQASIPGWNPKSCCSSRVPFSCLGEAEIGVHKVVVGCRVRGRLGQSKPSVALHERQPLQHRHRLLCEYLLVVIRRERRLIDTRTDLQPASATSSLSTALHCTHCTGLHCGSH